MRYKIILVPFPFDNLKTNKVRPVVCLTEPFGKFNHVIFAFITSKNPKDKTETDIELESNEETGLKVKSVLRLHRVISLPVSLAKTQLGQLSVSKVKELNEKLKNLFAIN